MQLITIITPKYEACSIKDTLDFRNITFHPDANSALEVRFKITVYANLSFVIILMAIINNKLRKIFGLFRSISGIPKEKVFLLQY